MVRITYIDVTGASHVIDGAVGQSVMEAAVKNSVPGIVGECGGSCACGTCRVYVDAAWKAATGEAGDIERGTIDFARDTEQSCRLSCQIKITEALDGLTVRTPECQY